MSKKPKLTSPSRTIVEKPSAHRASRRRLAMLTVAIPMLTLIVLWLSASQSGAQGPAVPLSPIVVNSFQDAVDAAPGDAVCASAAGACTLRAAVMEANALDGPNAVILPGGAYTITLKGNSEDAALTGDIDITDDLTLQGTGATATIIDGRVPRPNDDPFTFDRVLDIHPGIEVINNCTIAGNRGYGLWGGTGPIANSIVVDACATSYPFPRVASLGHNIVLSTSCLLPGPGDQIGVDPQLGPLQDFGGGTYTHALLGDSPAIDAANPALCPQIDQPGAIATVIFRARVASQATVGSSITNLAQIDDGRESLVLGATVRVADGSVWLPIIRR